MQEQKLNSEQKDETQLPSSPNNSNTPVVCSLDLANIETRIISNKTTDFKKSLMICFYDEEQKINVLDGLTKEESLFFEKIVSMQINKGIRIKIDYSYVLY